MHAKTAIAFFLALAACGCGGGAALMKEDVFGKPQVLDARQDLSGMNDQTIRSLAKIYIREHKIFMYASGYTNAPVVAKSDIPLAAQLKTAAVTSGFSEAAKFNGYMLEYVRQELKEGRCPEHQFVELRQVPVVYQRLPTLANRKKAARGEIALVEETANSSSPRNGFVCPVDKRAYVPYDLNKKPKQKPAAEQQQQAQPGKLTSP